MERHVLVLLLEDCDLDCSHCGRGVFGGQSRMFPGYQLTLVQVETCLTDCRRLEGPTTVHFCGGEPTLWSDEGADLTDLLVRVAACGLFPSFITNGLNLEDPARCRELVSRYFAASSAPLTIWVSVDTYHRNFDPSTERCSSVDQLLLARDALPRARRDLLRLNVVAAISKDPGSLLPEGMVAHYESRGVPFDFEPLLPIGRARRFAELCPDLESDDPADLGAFAVFADRPREAQKEVFHLALAGEDYFSRGLRIGSLGTLNESVLAPYARPAALKSKIRRQEETL